MLRAKRCVAIVLSIAMVAMNMSYAWALPDAESTPVKESVSEVAETTPSDAEPEVDEDGVLVDGIVSDDTDASSSDALEDPLAGIPALMVDAPTPLVPGAAKVTAMYIASTIDGTNYTLSDGPGLDSAGDNNICRTFDTVTYNLNYTTALKDASIAGFTSGDVYFEARIPNATLDKVQFDTAAMSWAEGVEQKQVGDDIVLTGYRHLTNGNLPTCIPGAGTLSFSVYVKGSANGDKYQPEFNIWLDGDQEDTQSATGNEFTVSAKQAMNLKVDLGIGGEEYGDKTSSNNVHLGMGVIQNFDVKVQVGDETTPKGSEAPKGQITFNLKLTGTRIQNPSTVVGSPNTTVAYIQTDSGTASYEDNGDGTVTVTLDNYTMPDMSATTATSPLDVIKLKVGVFQEQPTTIESGYKYVVEIRDQDLSATSISGAVLPASTNANKNDNQTITTDDQNTKAFEYVLGSISPSTRFLSRTSIDLSNTELTSDVKSMPMQFVYNTANELGVGQTTIASTFIASPRLGTLTNCVRGAEVLIKFDDKTLEIDDNPKWSLNVYADSDEMVQNGTSTLRFAAKKNGEGWIDSVECGKASMRDLVYYDTMAELKAAGDTCVGVVCEIRDVSARRAANPESSINNTNDIGGANFAVEMHVKNDLSLVDNKAVPYFTATHRYYTSNSDIPTVDEHVDTSADVKTAEWEGSINNAETDWHSNSRTGADWSANYWDGDDRKTGTYNWLLGYSAYLVKSTAKMNYAIESQDENGNPKTVYNLEDSNKVDLVLTPEINATIDDKHSAVYYVLEPTGMHLDTDNIVIGGTYDPATGTVSGGRKVKPTSVLVSGGQNVYKFENTSISNSEILPMHVSMYFDDSVVNGQSFSARAQFSYGPEGPTSGAYSVGYKYATFRVIKVGDIKFSKVVETTDKTDATGTEAGNKQGLSYKIGLQNTSGIDINDMKVVDVLSYNGDSLDTDFEGYYEVNPISIDLKGNTVSANNIKLYYTTSTSVQIDGYNGRDVDVTDSSIWTEATNTGTDADPVYTVDKKTTAVVLTGNLPVDTEYTLKIPFDTLNMKGELGNQATVASPDLATDTPGKDGIVTTNGTSTIVIAKVNVTNNLTNIKTNNTSTTAEYNKDYEETLTAEEGYRLPDTIDVTVGGTSLTPAADPTNPRTGEYIYDQTTGKVKVPGDEVTDDIVVTAVAIKQVELTNTLTNITTDKPIKETMDANTPYTETLTAAPGYILPTSIEVWMNGASTIVMSTGPSVGGISYDRNTGKITFDDTVMRDDIEIIANADPIQYTVEFKTDAGGTLSGDGDQQIDYKSTAAAGATATPDATHIFLGWQYDYDGVDGVHYSGTTTNYTTVPIMNNVTFTAKYAKKDSVSATADHGYVSTSASTTPSTVGTDTTSTTELVEVGGKKPGSVGFESQDNYTPETIKVTTDESTDTIVITDKDGNVVTAIDPTKPGEYTIEITHTDSTVETTTVAVTPESDTTPGSIVSTDITTGMKFDIGFKPQGYNLTNTLTGLDSSKTGTQKVEYGTDYTETLLPKYVSGSKYLLPESITVKVGGTELTQANDPANPQPGEFGYDSTTGKVTIPGGEITGDVEIIGIADVPVTNTLTNITTDNTDTKIQMGTEYSETLSVPAGYRLPDEITVKVGGKTLTPAADPANPQPGEYVYDKTTGKVTVPGSETTGSIEITAEAVKIVELTNDIAHGTNSKGDEKIDEGVDYTTTLVPDKGYVLPETITINIGGTDYTVTSGTPSTDGITYDKTTGKLDIPGDIITDDVKITATCEKKQFTVTTDVTNGSGTNVSGGIDMYDPYDTVIIPDRGYLIPSRVTVTIGGTKYTITSGKPVDGITYDKTTGELHIPGELVVGDIELKAVCTSPSPSGSGSGGGGGSIVGAHAANPTETTTASQTLTQTVTTETTVDPRYGLNPDGTPRGNMGLNGIPKTGERAVEILTMLIAILAVIAGGVLMVRRRETTKR